jgi:membrane protein required for colicin V production
MNWLDIVILVLIVIPAVAGLRFGIIKILFTVVGIIVGVVLAGQFSGSLAGMLTFIKDPGWAKIAAFAFIMIAVLILAGVAAGLLSSILSAILLGWVNRLGGAVLGIVLGGIFCGAILTMWVKFLGIGDTISDSALAGFLLDGFPFILALLPGEFDSVRSFFD